ncbi:MAG TPA: AarF/UbiB family protein [Thermoanaerobaculia bacterium]|nr:AarF/UbiB family protein [Thermoanaerobaculia bacterium]
MLKTRHLGAYKDLLVLLTRYGRRDFRLELENEELLLPATGEGPIEPDVRRRAEAFAAALKQMGPAYVKFGQLLSTRPDIVPPEYIAVLESFQDNVEPFSFADVERIVEEELGAKISKVFEEFEAVPVAAASLGQVHRAVLRDGREVVVKVQRPNVGQQIREELDVLTEIAETLEAHTEMGRRLNLVGAIEQARMSMLSELNYLQEARNTEILRHNLESFPQIYIPAVIHDLSSSRVLTTELVKGRKISKLTPLALIENDYAELASVLTRAYLKQICVDGIWHSDPHPGNVFIREIDGAPQVVLLDFGMTARISSEFQDEIIKLLLAISSNGGAEVAGSWVRLSDEADESFDALHFTREISALVATVHDVSASSINTGQLIFNVISIGNNNGLKAPPEMTMLAKTLLHLDAITRRLDADFNPHTVIRDYAEQLMTQKLQQKFNPRNFYAALLDLNQLVLDFPHHARQIIDLTADGKLTFGLKLVQAEEFLAGIHKIANRITVGLIIAAIVLASALMMRTQPALAITGYVGASIIGLYLALSTLLHDRKDQARARLKGK